MIFPDLLETPLFGLTLTLTIYGLAQKIYRRSSFFLLHPVFVTVVLIILFLLAGGIDYETYNLGGRYLLFLLGPSVVALGLPLFDRLREFRARLPVILAATILAGTAGIVSVVVPLILAGVPEEIIVSLAPKSVTTPIAMSIVEATGGEPSLTAAVVVLTGILGAVLGPALLKIAGITSGISFGLAMGNSAHGIGTARALETGELEGAAGGLAICLNGIVTAVLTPPLLGLLLG